MQLALARGAVGADLARKAASVVLLVLGAFAMLLAITVPLSIAQQLTVSIAAFGAAYALHRFDKSRRATIGLVVLSAALSTRYLFWRATQTLEFDNPLAFALGMALFLTECYAWTILMLGYMQCIWPLSRPVRQIQGRPSSWPTVDVYVPTYNESLDIVQDTVLAAMSIDYPPDRFRVYILDDGRRPEFEAFAKAAGCGYITRPDNKGAKAGNLNNALSQTSGELITVFDADHVATRAFLQFTVGWFQADPKLALLQTPHFFYSPDPVQRNIAAVRDMQGEGALFYGVVQEGNDFWNATFFCGSCAIIRREALRQTNGFAEETVTEDAHTALKLQRLGWNTAYINVRLSAGLATERLALHIGQRARWARGMTQIFRIDNPLLGPGLTFSQRLCYLSAMLAFQFALPRIIFLVSPLAFLLLGQSIIHAAPLMIIAFAGPHLAFSHFVNGRIQGKYSRSLWSEIYETIIAFHLVRPSLLPLFNPKAGKFNVTDKGGLLEDSYFDWTSLRPHLICIALLVLGLLVGLARLISAPDLDTVGTLVLNLFWSLASLLMLTTACVVGRETRQVRVNLRAHVELPATLYFEDGHIMDATTHDVSMGGVSVRLDNADAVADRKVTHIEIQMGDRLFLFPTDMLRARAGRLALRFKQLSIENRRGLVRVVFGRADAWPSADDAPQMTFFGALRDLIKASASLLPWYAPATARRQRSAGKVSARASDAAERARKPVPAAAALGVGALLLGAAAAVVPSQAQAAPSAGAGAAAAAAEGVRNVSLTLKDLGIAQPLQLIGVLGEAGIPYNVRADEVVTRASLSLNFAYSPQLLPDLSHLTVLLNDEVVGSIELVRDGAGGVTLDIPIDPGLFSARNRLNFRFVGHYTRDCEDPLHSTLWANISNTRTKLNLTLQRLPTGYDLARLPVPFFDASDPSKLRLPFVFLDNPSNKTLAAAGAVAGYFGLQAGYRGFNFPVAYALPEGDAVVIAHAGASRGQAFLPRIDGPTVALVRNPRNRFSTLLVVAGRSDAELLAAARVLAAAPTSLSGAQARVAPRSLPARKPWDAPRWLQTDKPVRLGDLVATEQLEGAGLRPGVLLAPFRTAPDLFFWPRQGGMVNVGYRYPAGAWLDFRMSRMDVLMNGKFLRSFPLGGAGLGTSIEEALNGAVAKHDGKVDVPGYNLFSSNQLQFYYDLRVAKKGRCQGEVPGNIRVGIDPDSKLDLTHAHHFAQLPDLAFFTNSGFPYTRMADLSETMVVVAPRPTPTEITTYLELMGRFADATGLSPLGVQVTRPGDAAVLKGSDVLVIGSIGLASMLPDLFKGAPIQSVGGRLQVRSSGPLERFFDLFGSNPTRPERDLVDDVLVSTGSLAAIQSWRSPADGERVVTALLSASPAKLPLLVAGMADPKASYRIQGDVAVAGHEGFTSARVGESFWSGELPVTILVMWWASRNPLMLAVILVLSSLVLGSGAYAFLKAHERRRLRDLGDK